jgi:transposase
MDQVTASPTVERTNERANEPRSSVLTEQIELRVRQERHRRWRPEERLRIIRETLRPGVVIAEVARRHGIGTGLLYT